MQLREECSHALAAVSSSRRETRSHGDVHQPTEGLTVPCWCGVCVWQVEQLSGLLRAMSDQLDWQQGQDGG